MAWTIAHTHKVKITAVVFHEASKHSFEMVTKFPFIVLPPDQPMTGKGKAIEPANPTVVDGANDHEEAEPPACNDEAPASNEKESLPK